MMLITAIVSATRSAVVQFVKPRSKKSVQRDEEVAAVPSAHGERESKQHALDWTQTSPAGNQLDSHPERQNGADGVTDEL